MKQPAAYMKDICDYSALEMRRDISDTLKHH